MAMVSFGFILYFFMIKGEKKRRETGSPRARSRTPRSNDATSNVRKRFKDTEERKKKKLIRRRSSEEKRKKQKLLRRKLSSEKKKKQSQKNTVRVLYATTTGTSMKFAKELVQSLRRGGKDDVDQMNLKNYDQDNLEHENVVIFLISTWTGGKPAASGSVFFEWLEDMAKDFRVSQDFLSGIRFAVFGLGNREYDENFCRAAKELQMNMEKLGAQSILDCGEGDDNVDQHRTFRDWSKKLCTMLLGDSVARGGEGKKKKWLSKREKRRLQRLERKKLEEEEDLKEEEEDLINDRLLAEADNLEEEKEEEGEKKNENDDGDDDDSLLDVEDVAKRMMEAQKQKQIEEKSDTPREMVTPKQRKALTKEGYKIIGTHSAVKLCRWTKHQLRGRGGCYKHTCYGITSYQCISVLFLLYFFAPTHTNTNTRTHTHTGMEATPSLACANKCTFCWRHHKNPVGREWRWKEDEPSRIVNEAIEKHRRMIKEFRGVKGVKPERAEEAMTVRHCALSLVGEPIMYPKINKMLGLLHERHISTFLVTNAQFPDRIKHLDPVTQLYVSIDAATPETLKAVDRPLFKDYWERFISCLDALKAKRQRTVYRLTLIKGWNTKQIQDYAKLVSRGEPDFIEIKAVTYSGKSDGSDLTMKNVPWYEEVCKFSEALVAKLKDGTYGIASAHRHSCLVLLAKRKFCIDGIWNTWINYPKFHTLMKRYYDTNGKKTFTAMDYMAPTPSWALYGAKEEGFDPEETRFRRERKKNGKPVRKYVPSESGCG